MQSGDKPTDDLILRNETIPAGTVYIAFAAFTGSGATEQSTIMFKRSTVRRRMGSSRHSLRKWRSDRDEDL